MRVCQRLSSTHLYFEILDTHTHSSKTNAIGQGSEGQGSEGQTCPDREGQGREGRAGTPDSAKLKSRNASELEHSEKASFALVSYVGRESADSAKLEESAKASFALVSYAGVKVETLPTLSPAALPAARQVHEHMQRTSACVSYVSIRQHTSAYFSKRQHTSAYESADTLPLSPAALPAAR
jgi:hypothetical protein